MSSPISNEDFFDFMDVFVKSTREVVPTAAELEGYLPTLYLEEAEGGQFNVLQNEPDKVLTLDVLLEWTREMGKQWYAEHHSWPKAAAIAFRDALGITILGCTEDARMVIVMLSYKESSIHVERGTFCYPKEGFARNPAAWFYASGPLKSVVPAPSE